VVVWRAPLPLLRLAPSLLRQSQGHRTVEARHLEPAAQLWEPCVLPLMAAGSPRLGSSALQSQHQP
jgi:hypothetical protein